MTCKHIKAVFPRLMFPNKSGNDVSFIHDFGSLWYVNLSKILYKTAIWICIWKGYDSSISMTINLLSKIWLRLAFCFVITFQLPKQNSQRNYVTNLQHKK